MTIAVSTMFITVHDAEAALGFYRDILGLEVRKDIRKGDFRWVTVGAPGQAVDVVLSDAYGGRSERDGKALLELVAKGAMQAAIFSVADLDEVFGTIDREGVEILQEPVSQPWGVRDFAVRDPSGNLIRIAQA